MRRVVLRVREDAVEDVLDALLPLLADGVHERPAPAGAVELVAHALTGPLPPREELVAMIGDALISLDERDVPEDWRERRRLDGAGGFAIAGRIWLRSPLDPPPVPGLLDVVIERSAAFGTGAHPTTRMCLSLMTDIEPVRRVRRPRLRCRRARDRGRAARLRARRCRRPRRAQRGRRPRERAPQRRRGPRLRARPAHRGRSPAHAVAANVPAAVHAGLATRLPETVEHLIVSGIRPPSRDEVLGYYAAAGLALHDEREEGGWIALALERNH